MAHVAAWGLGAATSREIADAGLGTAVRLAIRRAYADLIAKLQRAPDILLTDAVTLRNPPVRVESHPKADQRCLSVAMASILAKVHRDRLMRRFDQVYPCYDFANHKDMARAGINWHCPTLAPAPFIEPPFAPSCAPHPSFFTQHTRPKTPLWTQKKRASFMTPTVKSLQRWQEPLPKGRPRSGKPNNESEQAAPGHRTVGRGRGGPLPSRTGLHNSHPQLSHACGELDIVARDGDAIVFVEVKTRRTTSFGPPQAAVTAAKAAHIIAAAQHYLLDTEQIDGQWRIDVVAVFGSPRSSPQITLIRSAVEAN